MSNSWEKLGLHRWINDQLVGMNITKPTPIQEDCIPQIMSGKDCIGCAETGSGKTAVFALPILQKLSEDPYGVCALILTPTRELALQISDQFLAFGRFIRVKVSLIVGGESLTFQSINLSQKPHVVVATLGRLASILRENILDEVDALMVPGEFEQDLETILDTLPPPSSRQTLAFSATSSGVIETLKKSLNSSSLHIFINNNIVTTASELNEFYLLAPNIAKDAFLVHLLRTKLGLVIENEEGKGFITSKDQSTTNPDRQAIIFTSSCWQCHVTARLLLKLGFKCAVLHSALTQPIRKRALLNFRSRQCRILVATALAGRGLDIPSVDLVINFSLPYSPDEYIHHVGRTARAGRPGTAISLIAPYELNRFLAIENHIGKKTQEFKFDDEKEAEKLVKSCAMLRKEIANELYHNTDNKLNQKIERNKKHRKERRVKNKMNVVDSSSKN